MPKDHRGPGSFETQCRAYHLSKTCTSSEATLSWNWKMYFHVSMPGY